MASYPTFTSPGAQAAFLHWLEGEGRHTGCDECAWIERVVKFTTSLFLESLFFTHAGYLSGSDAASVYSGRVTKKWARRVLAGGEPPGEDFFPGLRYDPRFAAYVPFLSEGANDLSVTLSELYEAVLERKPRDIWAVYYCLLCFHVAGQYLLTPNTALDMWTTPLFDSSVSSLISISDPLAQLRD